MENPFLNSPTHLAKQWRLIRSQLTVEKSDLEQLQLVTKFWSQAPLLSAFLNWDSPNIWLNPWEFIAEMKFDISSVALGMEYTLLLGADQRWTNDRLTLALSCTRDKSQQLLVLIVDQLYVLNYEYTCVVPWDEACKELVIQQNYQYSNKMHRFKDL